VKKAITHLKLERVNPGKLHRLDELAVEHQHMVQAYMNGLIAHTMRQPDQYAHIPERIFPRGYRIAGSAAPGSNPAGWCNPGTAMRARPHRSCTIFVCKPTPTWS
jgi:hypothetical protein